MMQLLIVRCPQVVLAAATIPLAGQEKDKDNKAPNKAKDAKAGKRHRQEGQAGRQGEGPPRTPPRTPRPKLDKDKEHRAAKRPARSV